MNKLIERFKQADHVVAKAIGAFCVVMIPVIASISFANPVWNDYKSVAYIGLSAIAFLCNFTKQKTE